MAPGGLAVVAMGLAVVAIGLAACGSAGSSPAPAGSSPAPAGSSPGTPSATAPRTSPRTSVQTITLYNGQHPQVTDILVKAFEQATGIQVRVHSGESPELANQILQEGKSSPADVFLAENSPALMALEGKGRLAEVPASTLAQIPSRYDSPQGDWVGVVAREDVLAYDPSRVPASTLPSSLLSLARPRWKGEVAIAPADADFLPLVSAVAALDGRARALQWLQGLQANAQVFQNDEGVIAAVNRGSVATGIVNNYYWFRLRAQVRAKGMHCALHYFGHHDVGALLNVSGAGVLASSRHQRAANAFLDFLVSQKAQKLLAHSHVDFEYPLRPGVAPNPALRPLGELSPPPVGVAQLGDDKVAASLLSQAGLL
ncbi:MAG: extracellular solute-binding protein [Acidimicrobiales bacterium]